MDNMQNTNKVVLVTGGISGIGRLITIELAKRGYIVYASTREIQSEDVSTIKTKANDENLTIIPVYIDLQQSDSITKAVATIIKDKGHIDILVNNAGIGYFAAIEDIKPDEFMNEVQVNVLGAVQTTQAVLPHMREQHSGKIINMSSIMGFSTAPLNGPYSASKYALEAITETLAVEVKRFGIDVILLQIGDFHSSFLKNALKHSYSSESAYYKLYKRQETKIGAGDRGKDPVAVANFIVKLCNEKNNNLRYMVGREVFLRKILYTILNSFGNGWTKFLRFYYKW